MSGQEAKILDHIGIHTAIYIVCANSTFLCVGEKLAKKLDKKLMQHRASEGMYTSDDAACVAAETKKKPRLATPVEEEHYSTTASPKKRKVMKLSVVNFHYHMSMILTEDSGICSRVPVWTVCNHHCPPQGTTGEVGEYLPVMSYIQCTSPSSSPSSSPPPPPLLLPVQKPNWIGYLTKAQLMTQAQPYSDKSFTIVRNFMLTWCMCRVALG